MKSQIPDPRSIEQALSDLRAKYEKQPDDPMLARMIQQLEAELAIRRRMSGREN